MKDIRIYLLYLCILLNEALTVSADACGTTGIWGEWGPWTTCPNTGDPTWDYISRQRECKPQPTGCTQTQPFTCPGKYSEVEFCNTTPAPRSTEPMNTTPANNNDASSPAASAQTIPAEATTDGAPPSAAANTSAQTTQSTPKTTPSTITTRATQTTPQTTSTTTTRPPTTQAQVTLTTTKPTTTSFTQIVCDNCQDLNVFLYKGNPYQDGASVLNRYTSSGCKFVQFFCRPIELNDHSAMRTVYNQNINASAPLNANIQCQNGKWYDEANHTEISSLSCIYDPGSGQSATTNVPTTTLIPTTTSDLRSAPIVNHDIPCQNCSQLVVNPQIDQAGSATLNFDLGDCLTVDVFCQPVQNFTTVDLLFDGVSVGLIGSTINRTFTCNNNTQWVDVTTGRIVQNIACSMVNSSTSTVATTTTTKSTGVTTPDPLGNCDKCPNVLAQPLTKAGYYNGMLVLDHYSQGTKCRIIDISCQGNSVSEMAAIIFNSDSFADYGQGAQHITINCSPNGTWLWSGLNVVDASCLVTSSGQQLPSTMSTLPPTQPVTTSLAPGITTTTMDPGIVACNSCIRLGVTSIGLGSFEDGFTTLQNGNNGQCMVVAVTCQGETTTENVALFAGNNLLTSSTGTVRMNLTCNQFHVWTSPSGVVIDSLSCGALKTTTTMPITTTATPFTTPLLGQCANCDNIEAVPLSWSGYQNGKLEVFINTSPYGCRMATIECSASTVSQAIVANSQTVLSAGPSSGSLVVTCDANARWNYYGTIIDTVSCIWTANPASTIAPVTTVSPTSPPTLPTTIAGPDATTQSPSIAACNKCSYSDGNSNSMSLPGSNNQAFLIVDYGTNGQCKTLSTTCQGASPTDSAVLFTQAQTAQSSFSILSNSTGSATMSFTCNSQSQWVMSNGTALTGALTTYCATFNASTSTQAITTTTAAPPSAPTLCSQCPNMNALSISNPSSTVTNGQLILDHYTQSETGCKVVVIRCWAPDTYHNASILYNGQTDAASVITSPGQVSSSLVCDSQGQWLRLGESITGVACMVQALPEGVTNPPVLPTTSAPEITVPPQTGESACQQCSRTLVSSVPAGYDGGFLTMDTKTNPCLSVFLSCSAPDRISQVSILSASGSVLMTANGQTNLTVSCNTAAQWLSTSNGQILTGISCGVVAATTTSTTTLAPTTTTTAPTTLPTTTTTLAPSGGDGCAASSWAAWQGWSTCTDECGACGTWQRFRACNKAGPDCLCNGTAYEKVPCNLDVCKYPRTPSCCSPYTPQSGSNGVFQCLPVAG